MMRINRSFIILSIIAPLTALALACGGPDTLPPMDDLSPLAVVCQGQAVPQADAYQARPGLHRLLWIDQTDEKTEINLQAPLPINWMPTIITTTELIACIGPQINQLVKDCETSNGTEEIYRYEREVRLYETHTGQLLDSTVIPGENSGTPECNLQALGRTRTQLGQEVNPKDIEAWLKPYVDGTIDK